VSLEVPVDLGEGPALVLLHGFAMRPATYAALARLLAERCRVVVPDLFDVRGQWRHDRVVDAFTATLDRLGIDRATLVGHSFGGALELGFASQFPDRVVELVFSDTLAASRELRLGAEALRHPLRLLRLATPTAAAAFASTWAEHPRQLVDAAWWGFRSSREFDSRVVARAGITAHVLWANRDSVLSQGDGRRFAQELAASFTVAAGRPGQVLDHDWMFQQPRLFRHHLEGLGLRAFGAARGRRPPPTAA